MYVISLVLKIILKTRSIRHIYVDRLNKIQHIYTYIHTHIQE